jgi:triosephosphate isomerase
MGKMLILINFKTYPEAFGEAGLKLAKICESVAKKYKVEIAVAPQLLDLEKICSAVKIPVFSQHVDAKEGEKNTGSVLPESIKKIGAKGSMLNHSEKRLKHEEIKMAIKLLSKNGLVSVCCTKDLNEAKKIAKLSPNFLAYEEPSLIASGRAISKVEPQKVKNFVSIVSKINPKVIPLCGAGISSAEDVKLAFELGTKGVIIASAIVKSKNPKPLLEEIAEVAKNYS